VKFHTKFKINNKCMPPEIGKSHNTFDSPLYWVWVPKKSLVRNESPKAS